jgi:hypothetical protein
MTDRPDDVASELLALSVGYAEAADDRDGARFAALFTDDGQLVVPVPPDQLDPVKTLAGAEVLRSVPSGLAGYEWTLHQVVDHLFALPVPGGDPATAAGRVEGVAHHVRATGDPPGPAGTDTVWYLTYLDRYRRVDHRWRIARRELYLHRVEVEPVEDVGQRAGTTRGGGGPT